jgi:hypothetical protein
MSLWETISALGFGAFLGYIIEHLFSRARNKTEREFLLKKEEHFQRQQKAEILLKYLKIYEMKISFYFNQVRNGLLEDLFSPETELENKKMKEMQEDIFSIFHLYFSGLHDDFSRFSVAASTFLDLYFDLQRRAIGQKSANLTEDEAGKLPILLKRFHNERIALVGSIQKFLEKERKNMIIF